ncbi:TetR/AcrR family transcriptional regulator [Streptomyces oceani]|uniref:TetR family transcriptional regulator n=1 Tax=Streptomyces oceani TaxID=1075402 RepID=A0A1E7KNW3_9ACTN|nr:TetR/AcrR family transcriptional regulator [Streptomyces oceani]OEV05597.1 TetR family transcriptional regulator [Streptomyces oceani]
MAPRRRTKAPQKGSIEILWGDRNTPSRGPRPGLSVEAIAETAIEIADADGLDALSMQAVASRLGYTAMSLYRYVPGKEQLVDVIYDTAIGPPPPAHTPEGDWRAGVQAWVWAVQDVYAQHPWLLRVAANTPPLGPNQLAWFDTLLHHVSEVGLEQEEMLHLVIFVSGAVRDLARTSTDLSESPRRTGVPVERMGEEYAVAMKHLTDEARFPTLSKMVAADMFEPDGNAYNDIRPSLDFGLQRLLDGIDSYVSARAR